VTECGKLIVFGRPFDFNTIMRINGIHESFGSGAARTMNMLSLWIDKEAESGLYLKPIHMEGVEEVQDVQASAGLTLARTKSGEVWAFGLNRWGQCGSGDMSTHVFEPTRVRGLPAVLTMDCGLQHCLALSEDGSVFAWGKGNRGQLGDELVDSSASPVRVAMPRQVKAVGVSAGFAHSAALAEDGSVWVWGKGMSADAKGDGSASAMMPSSAAIEQFHDQVFPRRLALPGGRLAVQVVSSIYTLAALADDGSLWLMGMGEYDRNRLPNFIQVHDVYTEDEQAASAGGVAFRGATIPKGSQLLKGHNRITVLVGSVALQAVLHAKEAFLQPLEGAPAADKLSDLAVGWKQELARVEDYE
jgi:hypothetical protein